MSKLASAVRAEQVRTLYRQSVWVFIANPVNALITALCLWQRAQHGALLAWVAGMGAVAVGRLALRQRYLRANPGADDSGPWITRFVIGAAATGAGWGVGGALFFDPADPIVQLIVTFVVGGMIAGASGTLAAYVPAFIGFALPALVGLAGRIMVIGDTAHVGFVFLMLVYGVVMTMVATNTQRAIIATFRLRFENDELLAQLTNARASLENVNRTLEERVAERTLAFERQSETLRDAQRMESIGLLAGGVAHDFNNLLTVVLANVALLEGGELKEPERISVEEIRTSANRGAALVSQLLAFSRRQILKPQTLDLARVAAEMEQFLRRLIGTQVDLAVIIPPGTLPVTADPSQLQQVIINLATNARDAMPSGGQLTIEAGSFDKVQGGPGPDVPPGPYATLVVTDTGVGMDAETRRLAFHPFFTTKELGRGTGLGLATVYGIVDQSGGFIFVESQPAKGSSFAVYLPRVTGAAAAALLAEEPAKAAAPTPPRRGTVLLAEDNPMVRDVAARILRTAGHAVLLACDGQEGLEVAAKQVGPLDLLVTDLVMGRMGGIELAKRLAEARPELRILFISGFAWDNSLPAIDPARGIDFLQKPFAPDALVEAVRRLMDAPSRRRSDSGPNRQPAVS